APVPQPKIADVTVSFGVGENANKRISGDFEYEVLLSLLRGKRPVLIDRGNGGEEAERVNALVERLVEGTGSPGLLHVHDGAHASFASHILQSKLYVGYDSAGQHVAAAGNVPLVSVFTGYVCERMFARWRPDNPAAQVIRVAEGEQSSALERTIHAISAAEAAE
ncbi:MAG: hypothetical protein M3Y57_19665, partial [Acidobacteriota bacterium]|nr:hypothetical protein [Acidobacteriota bacterium]